MGRLKTTTLPDPDGAGRNPASSTTYVYDAMGNLLSSTLTSATPDRVTSYAYDSMNRGIRIENPDGTYRTLQYHLVSHVIAETDELGRNTHYGPSHKKCNIGVIHGNPMRKRGTTFTGVFAISPSLTLRVTILHFFPNGPYAYDDRSRVVSVILADGNTIVTNYDGGGRMVGVTDPRGNTASEFWESTRWRNRACIAA